MSAAHKWAFRELRDRACVYTDSVSERANFGRSTPLEWVLVWAYWHALFRVRDCGEFNMVMPPDAQHAHDWASEMARAFCKEFLRKDAVLGDFGCVVKSWYANCEAAEREYHVLKTSPEIRKLQRAIEVTDQRGGTLWSRHKGVLLVKCLSFPLEFVRTPDLDLRAVYAQWSKMTAHQQRDEAALSEAFPELPDHTLGLVWKTLTTHGDDVGRQVSVPAWLER